MDKVNFVTGFQPDKADFDMIQNSLESGLENVAKTVAGKGIKTGFHASITGSEISISEGIGFDGLGRLLIKAEPISANLGSIRRPVTGKYRWVSIALRYKITEQGQVIDINNQSNPAQYLDDVEVEIIDTEMDAMAEEIVKPVLTDYQVPLLDIKLDSTSAWEYLVIDRSRKPILLNTAELSEIMVNLDSNKEDKFDKNSGFNKDKSDEINSTDSKTIATSKAVKTAYDRGTTALNEANKKADKSYVNDTQFVPAGTIWMYDGDNWKDNITLKGWYACVVENEAKGCPDMTDRFVMGKVIAGNGVKGGKNSHTLTVAQLPSHAHDMTHGHGVSVGNQSLNHSHNVTGGAHKHQILTTDANSPAVAGFANQYGKFGFVGDIGGNNSWRSTNKAGSNLFRQIETHSHSVGHESLNHTHTVTINEFTGFTGDEGLGNTIDHRPAFYSMIYIKKVA